MTSAIATLSDLGWTPHDPDKWKSTTGDWWEYAGGTLTNILDEMHPCAKNTEWTKASAHLDGAGLEHRVGMSVFFTNNTLFL